MNTSSHSHTKKQKQHSLMSDLEVEEFLSDFSVLETESFPIGLGSIDGGESNIQETYDSIFSFPEGKYDNHSEDFLNCDTELHHTNDNASNCAVDNASNNVIENTMNITDNVVLTRGPPVPQQNQMFSFISRPDQQLVNYPNYLVQPCVMNPPQFTGSFKDNISESGVTITSTHSPVSSITSQTDSTISSPSPDRKGSTTKRRTSECSNPSEEDGYGSDIPKRKRKRAIQQIEEDNNKLKELLEKPSSALSKEEKREKRILRNRLSAQKSREKKKKETEGLQEKNDILTIENGELKEKLSMVQKENDLLKQENQRLKQLLSKCSNEGSSYTPGMGSPNVPIRSVPTRGILATVLLCIGFFFFISSISKPSNRVTPNAIFDGIKESNHVPSNVNINNADYPTSNVKITRSLLSTDENRIPERDVPSIHSHNTKTRYGNPHNDNGVYVDSEDGPTVHVNLDTMERSKLFYPKTLKKHFKFSENSQSSSSSIKRDHVKTTNTSTQEPTVVNVDDSVDKIFDPENSTMELPSQLSLSKRDTIDMNSFEKGYLYHLSTEEDTATGKKTIYFFCPFSYPLLPPPNESASDASFHSKEVNVRIFVPEKPVKTNLDSKVFRVAEIAAEKITLQEAFFAFPTK